MELLMTDVESPGGMSGWQEADAGRVARAGLAVLFITGYAENAVLSHGYLEHVLTKPFVMEAPINRIRELITSSGGKPTRERGFPEPWCMRRTPG